MKCEKLTDNGMYRQMDGQAERRTTANQKSSRDFGSGGLKTNEHLNKWSTFMKHFYQSLLDMVSSITIEQIDLAFCSKHINFIYLNRIFLGGVGSLHLRNFIVMYVNQLAVNINILACFLKSIMSFKVKNADSKTLNLVLL